MSLQLIRYIAYSWKSLRWLKQFLYASSRWSYHKQDFSYTTDLCSRFSTQEPVIYLYQRACWLELRVFSFYSLKQRPRPRQVSKMSGNDDMDDPELKAAIAASLKDFQGFANSRDYTSSKQRDVVDLTADSDDGDEVVEVYPKSRSVIGSETEEGEDSDADLERAIQMSMRNVSEKSEDSDGDELKEAIRISRQKDDSPQPVSVDGDKKPSSMGILGLDRKKMEEERLARFAKRKTDTMSPDQRVTKQSRTVSPKGRPSTKSPRKSPTPEPRKKQPRVKSVDTPTPTPSVQFPAGAIKKTWNANARRSGDDIKINEVFQASDLELAVLSSFMWDMDWLFSNLDTRKTRFLLIMQSKEESERRRHEADAAAVPNLRLCFPPMEGQVNCMHSKLMLLFHPGYVRIVVPTANLTAFDWGHSGTMENTVFLIDLPKKTGGGHNEDMKIAFYEELVYFLKASTLHENVIAKLGSFDFSQTAKFAFVHTIGGSHTGESWRRTGYCGLGRAVNSLGLRTSNSLNIDYVTSSLGSLNDDFLRSIYLAAQGDDGLTEYTARTPKSKTNPNPTPTNEWKDRLRVYFPSEQTVKETYGGPNSAGTICFQPSWFNGAKFPKSVLRDCASARRGLLMHNKIMYVKPDEPISLPSNETHPAWAYIGSANLSESAWGRLVQDRASTIKSNPKPPKLNCRNWECGVIVPVSESPGDSPEKKPDEKNKEGGGMLDIFHGTIPVPMTVPGKKYEGDDRLKPWYFMEGRSFGFGGF